VRFADHRLILGMAFVLAAMPILFPSAVRAQVFIAARPVPGFAIGPLTLRASVAEGGGPVALDVLWSIVLPANRTASELAQDLYLLWPGEVRGEATPGKPDPVLARYVEERGFDIVGEGRLPLVALSLAEGTGGAAEQPVGSATYVIFVQSGGTLGLSPPASFIRIPWSSRIADRAWLMDLRMKVNGLVRPRQATWVERLVVGQRSVLTLTFDEVRDRPLFAMYFAHRDRVVPLADAPSELVANFAHSDHLKIDQVFPPTAIRRTSENLESTQVVSLFLDKSEGITPQHLSVEFGYFSSPQAWALVLIPAVFFVLGQAMGPVLGRAALRAGTLVAARVHVGRWNAAPRLRETGRIIDREILRRIVPGETTREAIIRLCGPPAEVSEELTSPGRQTIVYRGRRIAPSARRVFGWLSTVRHWEVERHEVRIALEAGVVRDVQALTRHYRLAGEERDDPVPQREL